MKVVTRHKVISAASRLFYDLGYNNTGINQIIAEAGIVKSTLYQHFKSKEEIAVAYLQETHAFWERQFDTIQSIAISREQCIHLIFDFLEEWATERKYNGCVFINIISEIEASATSIRSEVKRHKTWLSTFLTQQFEKQGLGFGQTLALLIDGAIVQSQIQQQIQPIHIARKAAVLLLQTKT